MIGFYLAMSPEGGDSGPHYEYRDRAQLIRELRGEEIEPTHILRLDDGQYRDVTIEIAEDVARLWAAEADDYRLENGALPKFCHKHLPSLWMDHLAADELRDRADERAHVREISSPSLMGR